MNSVVNGKITTENTVPAGLLTQRLRSRRATSKLVAQVGDRVNVGDLLNIGRNGHVPVRNSNALWTRSAGECRIETCSIKSLWRCARRLRKRARPNIGLDLLSLSEMCRWISDRTSAFAYSARRRIGGCAEQPAQHRPRHRIFVIKGKLESVCSL